MSDKGLLVVISEMLRKQDQHSEILNKHSEILNNHTLLLEKQAETLEVMSHTLSNFMDVSIKQFDQQQEFNNQFLSLNEKVVNRLESIEKLLAHVVDMDERLKRLEAAVFK